MLYYIITLEKSIICGSVIILFYNKSVKVLFVCKGDRVTITASINGLSIKASGMALEDGNVGDSIKIENTTTDKVIVAKVLKQGEVRVVI